MTRADLPLLQRWLREPLVARWWHHETSDGALERDFGPALDGTDPTLLLVLQEDGRDVGLLQRYRIDDEPEYAAELAPLLDVPPGALSIDYLLGEPDVRGRGVGAAAIATAAAQAWRECPDATCLVVPVALGNEASWRALLRAGFRVAARGPLVPDNPVDPPDHVLLVLDRPG